MTTVTSSVRRSTRSPAPPSSSSAGNTTNNGLTPEETAFQLLKQELESDGWRDLSNKKCGLGFVFVKKGYSLDDAGKFYICRELCENLLRRCSSLASGCGST
jgi:hypothetical protein